MIIFNIFDNYFVVSAESQTFLGFEMTANFRHTSPLRTVRPFSVAHTFSVSRDGPRNSVSNKTKSLLWDYDYRKKKILGRVVGITKHPFFRDNWIPVALAKTSFSCKAISCTKILLN